jgi:hypothetical protein
MLEIPKSYKIIDNYFNTPENKTSFYKKELLPYIKGIIEIYNSLQDTNITEIQKKDEIREIFGLDSSFFIDLNNISKTSEDIFNVLYNFNNVIKGGNKRRKSITKKRKSKSNTKSKK